jgi:hypothetical protein
MNRNVQRHLICRITAGLYLVALFVVIGPAAYAEPPAQGTVSGTVRDLAGAPVNGARVWVNTTDQGAMVQAHTDGDGRFRLGPLRPIPRNPFDLLVDAPGLARQYVARRTYSVYPGVDADLGTIQLDRGGGFTGRLLDADGTPCPNALIQCELTPNSLAQETHVSWDGPAVVTLRTEAEGHFRTPPLPVALCYLFAQVPGRREATWVGYVRPGAEQALGTVRLEREVPIPGVIQDEQGRPIAGVKLRINYRYFETTDTAGRFTLHGQGPELYAFLDASRERYRDVTWHVAATDAGFRWNDVHGPGRSGHVAGKELVLVMEEETWIEGRAEDADTGEPIRLDRAVLCQFDRSPSGEVVLKSCKSTRLDLPEPGRFRIPYYTPAAYHLSLHAAGYREGASFTPEISRRRTITGLVVRMEKDRTGAHSARRPRSLTGRVSRSGRPLAVGWVALWWSSGFTGLLRGRTAVVPPQVAAYAPIRDGIYTLDAPFASDRWYVVAEEPGQPPTQLGPVPIREDAEETLDIACIEGGGICGRVTNVPAGWAGHLWVVAFTETSLRAEARIDADGRFSLASLAPGEYGLKVGHDAYDDADVPRGFPTPPLSTADPWTRARKVTVHPGRELDGIELVLPE